MPDTVSKNTTHQGYSRLKRGIILLPLRNFLPSLPFIPSNGRITVTPEISLLGNIPRKPQKTTAPQKAHQYRFSLVIQGMAEGDLIRLKILSRLKEEISTRLWRAVSSKEPFFSAFTLTFLIVQAKPSFLAKARQTRRL